MNLTSEQRKAVNYIPLSQYRISCYRYKTMRENACTVCPEHGAWAIQGGDYRVDVTSPADLDYPTWSIRWVDPDGTGRHTLPPDMIKFRSQEELRDQVFQKLLLALEDKAEGYNLDPDLLTGLYAYLTKLNKGGYHGVNGIAAQTRKLVNVNLRLLYDLKTCQAFTKPVVENCGNINDPGIVDCGIIKSRVNIYDLRDMIDEAVKECLA